MPIFIQAQYPAFSGPVPPWFVIYLLIWAVLGIGWFVYRVLSHDPSGTTESMVDVALAGALGSLLLFFWPAVIPGWLFVRWAERRNE